MAATKKCGCPENEALHTGVMANVSVGGDVSGNRSVS